MRRLLPLAVLLAPAVAAAAPTASCHCFQDRAYDPARPAAADPYVLATVRSSLLSAAFGPPKRALVAAVMSGSRPDDLFVAHWAAPRVGRDAAALLDALSAAGSWKAALAGARGLGPAFDAALARGAAAGELAALAVDDVLAARLGAPAAELRALREARASSAEVILAAVLAGRVGAPAPQLLAPVRAGKITWGALLASLGVAPSQLDALVRERVR